MIASVCCAARNEPTNNPFKHLEKHFDKRSHRRFAGIEGSLKLHRMNNRRSVPKPCVCWTTASAWMGDLRHASYELSMITGSAGAEGDHLSVGVEAAHAMAPGVLSTPAL